MQGCHIIVNPIAGSGRSIKGFKRVCELLESDGVSFTHSFTERVGHATELARAAVANDCKRIIVIGGDGTLREAAKALLDAKDVTLGILPFGSGNDLARALNIPTDPDEAYAIIRAGHSRKMDCGRANGDVFLNLAGTGFDVEVLERTEKFKRHLNGMLPYMLGILHALIGLKSFKAELTLDGKTITEELLLISIGNGTCFGGGIKVTPDADPFDGFFDVCIVKKVSRLTFLRILPKCVKGKHLNEKPVSLVRAKKIVVRCDEGRRVNLDGELVLTAPAEFEIIPGSIAVNVRDS